MSRSRSKDVSVTSGWGSGIENDPSLFGLASVWFMYQEVSLRLLCTADKPLGTMTDCHKLRKRISGYPSAGGSQVLHFPGELDRFSNGVETESGVRPSPYF
jgi:hypothetical protein